MERTQFYDTLVEQLGRRATRAVLGLCGFRNDALREYLRSLFDREAGTSGAFLADPVFEASFGWQPAERTLGGLERKPLHPDLVRALREPQKKGLSEDYSFPARRRPYRHQLEAWQILIQSQPLRSILVTSPTGGDSKSLVAANLAQAIAEQGQQIFLVEADLRSPSLEKVFAVESEFGLSDLLDRSAVLDQLVHPTAQPNLFMINAGKKVKNPTTLLASSAMRRFLDILENREQFIIVNAPAVLGVADASVLAANMSGVILVVSEESNNREQIFAALRQLQAARARMMGIIYVKKDQKGWGLS